MRSLLTGLLEWTDARFPLTKLWNEHLAHYYAPKNFNFWYFFGSLALLVLVLQIVTGIWLAMFYKPDAELAFESVEYIMRDVEWGWLIRYMHSTGASAFFIVVYLHMFRALLYGSYKAPRELLWIFGMLIYLCLMAEAFFGYLLPWGQMSYWGAQVIISLFGALPFGVGEALALWIRGDYVVSDATPEPLLRAARGGDPARPPRPGRRPRHGAARGRLEQPRRRGDQEEQGCERNPDGRRAVPPLLHGQGPLGRGGLPRALRDRRLLRAGVRRMVPRKRELRARESAANARAHPAGVVLHAVLRDPAGHPGQAHRRDRDVRGDTDLLHPPPGSTAIP